MTEKNSLKHIPARCLILCAGLAVMALGVAFSIQGALGTSPISSVPYVTSTLSGLSVGTTTIIMNVIFVLIQIVILRKKFEWFQLLQIPASFLFGAMIDAWGLVLQNITYSNYLQQWFLCILGFVLVALGVSIEVMAKLITNAGEGVVLSICKVCPIKFGNMKVIFDITLVCVSVSIGMIGLGRLDGVREGTVAAALFVGMITKQFSKPLTKFESKYLL